MLGALAGRGTAEKVWVGQAMASGAAMASPQGGRSDTPRDREPHSEEEAVEDADASCEGAGVEVEAEEVAEEDGGGAGSSRGELSREIGVYEGRGAVRA